MKKFIYFTIFLLVVIASGVIFVQFYSYIFAKTVVGVIENVEKPVNPVAVVNNSSSPDGIQETDKIMFSYAVAIRDPKTGEIFTSSAEDRQWAVAEKGKCVEAKFYPYPPWNLAKASTFFNARLIKMYNCPQE
jgi:hypothetical protein